MKQTSASEKNAGCACSKKSCPRNGDCAACRAFHLTRGTPTRCQRTIAKPAEQS